MCVSVSVELQAERASAHPVRRLAAPKSINHEGYDRRIQLVQAILAHYELRPAHIVPVGYDEHRRTAYHNFLYRIDLVSPATAANFGGAQPCTARPPASGVRSLIIRLANPLARGPHLTPNRIQNQVAAMQIGRRALAEQHSDSHYLGRLVPDVYAWHAIGGPHDSGAGWIMMEHRGGEPLDESFAGMASLQRRLVLEQVADVFAAIQAARLPAGVTRHGALAISPSGGEIVSAPWASHSTYGGLWSARLSARLVAADRDRLLQGWQPGGLRSRIEAFLGRGGVERVFAAAEVEEDRLALVHGDFTTSNILYDPATHRLTALLDFDSAIVTHPAHEFLISLSDVGGSSHAHDGDMTLRAAVITGRFDAYEGHSRRFLRFVRHFEGSVDDDAWMLARAWDVALEDRGAIRPSDVPGMVAIEAARDIEEAIRPSWVTSAAARMGSGEMASRRREAEDSLAAKVARMMAAASETTADQAAEEEAEAEEAEDEDDEEAEDDEEEEEEEQEIPEEEEGQEEPEAGKGAEWSRCWRERRGR